MWFAVILPAKQWNNRKVETNIILPARMNHHSLAGGVDCLPSSMHALKITIPKGSYSLSCSLVTQQSEGREVPGTAQLSCIEISLFHCTLMFQKKKKKKEKIFLPCPSPPFPPLHTLNWSVAAMKHCPGSISYLLAINFWLISYLIMLHILIFTWIFLRVICISRWRLYPKCPHSLKTGMNTHNEFSLEFGEY